MRYNRDMKSKYSIYEVDRDQGAGAFVENVYGTEDDAKDVADDLVSLKGGDFQVLDSDNIVVYETWED